MIWMMSLEQFAVEFLKILQIRRRLGNLSWEDRREAEQWIRERQSELKAQPAYWMFLYELTPK